MLDHQANRLIRRDIRSRTPADGGLEIRQHPAPVR
jgi:hypothetical protein